MAERRYRLKGKKLFNTYPQCPIPKEIALNLCNQKLRENLQSYIIAEELHKNGDKHLHCYLELADGVDTRDPRYFDLAFPVHLPGVVETYHGNYQSARSTKNVVKYCTKEEDYITNMDIAAILDAKQTHKRLGNRLLHEGVTLVALTNEHPELLFGYKKLQQDL